MRGHRGVLQIDLSKLAQNYQKIDAMSAENVKTGAAVKANAYGLGMAECAKALSLAGCEDFFVATIEEAVDLRGALVDAHIYVLAGYVDDAADLFFENRVTPILNSFFQLSLYARDCKARGIVGDALFHLDTGMNRLGMEEEDIAQILDQPEILDTINLRYVMSHFTSSEEAQNPSNRRQYDLFTERAAQIATVKSGFGMSLSNSGGIFAHADFHFDLTRPGIALYGGFPSDSCDVNPMSQLVNLSVPLLQIKHAKKGETAGYNETYRFHENKVIGVVCAGYADGLFRFLSKHGVLYFRGCKLPILGRVSMDAIICDLSEIPSGEMPEIGDMIEVIGEKQTIDDLAKSAGTISYEILTSLGARYRRIYKSESKSFISSGRSSSLIGAY